MDLVWYLRCTDMEMEAPTGDMLCLGWPSFPVTGPGGIPEFCSSEARLSLCPWPCPCQSCNKKWWMPSSQQDHLDSFPKAAITRYHKHGAFKNENLLCHSSGGRCLKSRCHLQGCFLLEAPREHLSHASVLASGGCWQPLASTLRLALPLIFSLGVCAQMSLFLKGRRSLG